MKKIIMILAVAILLSGVMFADEDYYNRNNPYDNYSYTDYEFRLSNAAFHLDRYKGDVYYYHHYRANVYFALVGPNVFVIPAYTFRAYMERPNFHWAGQNEFVALSAIKMPFHDSFARFNYYFSYYDDNRFSPRNHIRVTRNFRKYYKKRFSSKRYKKQKSAAQLLCATSEQKARVLRAKVAAHPAPSATAGKGSVKLAPVRVGHQPVNMAAYRAAKSISLRAKTGMSGSGMSHDSGSGSSNRSFASSVKFGSQKSAPAKAGTGKK